MTHLVRPQVKIWIFEKAGHEFAQVWMEGTDLAEMPKPVYFTDISLALRIGYKGNTFSVIINPSHERGPILRSKKRRICDTVHCFQVLEASIWPPVGWAGRMPSIPRSTHFASKSSNTTFPMQSPTPTSVTQTLPLGATESTSSPADSHALWQGQ